MAALIKDYERNYYQSGFIQLDAAKYLIDFAKPYVRCGSSLLDVGCGSGRVTNLIFDNLLPSKVIGVDQADGMIALAKKSTRNKLICYKHHAIEDYPTDFRFSHVFANSSFQWFSNYSAALSTIHHCLSPDGYFFIQSSYKERWCPEFLDIIESLKLQHSFINDLLSQHHFPCMHLASPQEYTTFLLGHRFSVTSIETKDFVYQLPQERAIDVFNSGPVKAYTSEKYYNNAVDPQAIDKFYSFFQLALAKKKKIQITYPRVFIRCQPQ
ncbi:MAG: class I SAM-dependent methyltransferase [Endozoicomonas sp. (ex Botrylloides leachii)]|nr:class I SAM-dependent methyltransferase [Endozoicomonas sp. (ex Botrylloides leachii)]